MPDAPAGEITDGLAHNATLTA